jgi:hypothetical protein
MIPVPQKNEPIVAISIPGVRSWDKVRTILNTSQYRVDLRKASKTNIPLEIQCDCNYETVLKINKKRISLLKIINVNVVDILLNGKIIS